MHARTCLGFFLLSAAAQLCCGAVPTLAQTVFNRNDNYAWPTHVFEVDGPDVNHLTAGFKVLSDYPKFTFSFNVGNWVGPGQAAYQLYRVTVDMDNNGTNEYDVTSYVQQTITPTYTYPEPSGWFQDYTIKVTLYFQALQGAGTIKTFYAPIKVAPSARVFADAGNNAFAQVRIEDCSNKTPVLLVEGIDAENLSFPWKHDIQYGPFLTDLLASGYEPFVLNFNQGGIRLQDNVPVVAKALDKIHELCPNHQIAVIGFSMGAIITRYALAQHEGQGIPHQVGLFISYDSPQEGAWVNPSLQDQVAATVTSAPHGIVESLKARVNNLAAMQMELYNPYNQAGDIFDAFQAEINALNNGTGYPHQSYNVAISNGNMLHSVDRGWLDAGEFLASLSIIVNGTGTPVYNILTQRDDLGAGGLSNNAPMIMRGDLFDIPSWVPFVGGTNVDFVLNQAKNPVFVPTWSGLGMKFLGANGAQQVIRNELGDIISHGPSPFDETVMQEVPRMHSEMSPSCETQIMALLNKGVNLTVNYTVPDGGSVTPDIYQGHILNMLSITVPAKTVTINGQQVTYAFSRWDDGSTQNPRAFFASHNGTRSVIMKAHLKTSLSGASLVNSQRPITEATDPAGQTQHAVYESGGYIWETRNRHNAGWDNEQLLSTGILASQSHAPTITAQSLSSTSEMIQVHTAWLTTNGPIVYRASNADNGATWMTPVEHWVGAAPQAVLLPDTKCSTPGVPSPCWPVLLWVDAGSPGIFAPGVYYMKSPRNSDASYLVPGTSGNVSAATVVFSQECPPAGGALGTTYRVAFIRGDSIYCGSFKDPGPSDLTVAPQSCSAPVNLTTPGWIASNPSLVMNGSDVLVAWEEASGSAHRIAYRQRTNGNWSAPVYFTHGSDVPSKPVLGVDATCGTLNVLWQCGAHVAQVSRPLANFQWGAVVDLGAGKSPNIVPSSTAKATAVWTSGSNAPYAVNFSNSFSCPDGGGGGCPFADTFGQDGWVTENSVLERTGGAVRWDVLKLETPPVAVNGRYTVRIRENENERSTIDAIRLVAVDHDSSLTAYPWKDGRILLGRRTPPVVVRTKNGDMTARVSTGTGSGFVGAPGDTAYLELPHTDAGPEDLDPLEIDPGDKGGGPDAMRRATPDMMRGETHDAMVLRSTGIIVQGRSASGEWQDVRRIYPRERFSPSIVDTLDNGPLRLIFVGRHPIQRIAKVVPVAAKQPTNASLVSARHTSLGNVLSQVASGDAQSVTLAAGDSIHCEFAAIPTTPGKVRSYFLAVRGFYTTVEPTSMRGQLNAPLEFAMGAVRPNPFGRSAVVELSIPTAMDVSLRVFDVQGRCVRRLVDERMSAGKHSVSWDGRDGMNRHLPPGVYLYRLETAVGQRNARVALLP